MQQATINQAGKLIMGCFARVLLDYDLLKLTDLPAVPKLFACNHPTTLDPFLINLITREPVHVLVTSSAFEVPVFRSYLHGAGHIPVERYKGKGAHTVAMAVDTLRQGKNVAIFPEGGLSPELNGGYGFLKPHSGVARIALASGAVVVPVGVSVNPQYIRKREYEFSGGLEEARWVQGGPYAVTVGQVLYFEGGFEDRRRVAEVAQQVMAEISKMAHISRERMNSRRVQWNSLFSLRTFFTVLPE
jgi:1-acyl-sn-glycerol-3-phosphate acyltransferase